MPELTLQRIPITVETDNRLRMLKSRTGINPNILCRIGFCLSLEELSAPPVPETKQRYGREINRYTLLGKFDSLFVALLKTRLIQDNISNDYIDKMFLAHLNRGIDLLTFRVKSCGDIGNIK